MTVPNEDNQTPAEQPPLPNGGRMYILIAEQEGGGVTVTGTINDRVVAYGLLEMARDLIQKHIESRLAPTIQPPSGGILNFARFGKKH